MSPKTKTLADGLIEKTSSMLDQIASKTLHKDAKGDRYRKKKLNESQSKTRIHSFLEIISVQKEFLP